LFEVLPILFVILAIVGSILQAAQKGKQTGTGFPPPIKTETRKIENEEAKRLSQSTKPTRRSTYKSVSKKTEETNFVVEEQRPVLKPIPAETEIKTDIQYDEILLDRNAVLNGVIFSVILSPPKCKRTDSIL